MINKLIDKIDNLINQITITFFIMFLLFGAYAIYDAHIVSNTAKLSKDILRLRPEESQESQFSLNPLKEINPDICAWIRINDTNIDYPIVRGKDNTEYLNRNYKKEYSTAGSLFLDYRNQSNFKDDYSIVYGHNMKSNYMFSDIKKFDNAEFFEQHKFGTLYTETEVYKMEIFCVARVNAFSNDIYNLVIYKNGKTSELISTFNSNASFKRALEFTGNDKLILLSTCSSSGSSDRLVLVARLVKFNAESDEDSILINEDAETILQNAENKKDKKEEEFKPYENKDSNNKKKFRLRISTRTLVIRILEFIVAIIFAIVIIQRIKLMIKRKRSGKNKVEKKEEEQNKEVKSNETENKKEKGKNKKITEIKEKIVTKVPKIMLGIKDKLRTIVQKAVTGIKKLGHILKRGVIGLKNKLVHMMQKAIIGIKELGHLVKRALVRIKNKLSHMVQKIITGIKNKVKRNDKTEEKTKEKNKDKTEKKVEEEKKTDNKNKTEEKTEKEKRVENKNNTKNKKKKKRK